ncbi:hypothetical protein [Candidatus Gromoviella agglomerans]|uniref:hypothetical protein n=1 Tax=Candidatus Gromoviella agglomerans TaxID=2806609 RepID=UPI001E39A390|nr:hypothetical protein [Candidatus Gromoviella agglomerans]
MTYDLLINTTSNNCYIELFGKRVDFLSESSYKRSNGLIFVLSTHRSDLIKVKNPLPVLNNDSAAGNRVAYAACLAIKLYVKFDC